MLLNIFLSITETIILLSKSPQIEKTIVFSDFLLISLVGFLALAEEFIRTKYLKKGKLMLILSMFIWIFSHKIIYSDGNFIKLLFLFLSGTIFTISTIYFHKIKLNYLLHILYNLTPFLVIVIL